MKPEGSILDLSGPLLCLRRQFYAWLVHLRSERDSVGLGPFLAWEDPFYVLDIRTGPPGSNQGLVTLSGFKGLLLVCEGSPEVSVAGSRLGDLYELMPIP